MSRQRIVSLLPAATELVCALGLENQLVGRSHECDYPESVKALPVCTETTLSNQMSSAVIDRIIKSRLSEALSVYTVNREQIKQLQPDVVITQTQCEACAVSLPEVEEALSETLEKPAQLLSLQPALLQEVLNNIMEVADALDVHEEGEQLHEALQDRLDLIRHKLKFADSRPTVVCLEWLEPLIISGNWVPELVELAGGAPVLAKPGAHSPAIEWIDLRLADPDIIVVMPCGFSIERSLKEIDLLLQLPGFADLQAVKNKRFYLADGNQYFNRPGPRIADSAEILAEIINPKQFIFGYEGEGWIKFDV